MKTYTKEELVAVLEAHVKWLRGEEGGVRADLSYADLSSANLRSADLRYADLSSANLRSADLRYADLSSANLRSANLRSANLRSANLRSANLRYAYLSSANLRYADLRYADLSYANLRSAVHGWAQVAFMGHGECGRMLTAVRLKEGENATYHCGCFMGDENALKKYIAEGSEHLRKTRTAAMDAVTMLLNLRNE